MCSLKADKYTPLKYVGSQSSVTEASCSLTSVIEREASDQAYIRNLVLLLNNYNRKFWE